MVARRCNTGFRYFTVDGKVIGNGRSPVLLEPGKAGISIASRAVAAVNILDHDGKRTGRALPVRASAFTIDGARDKALCYEAVFAR